MNRFIKMIPSIVRNRKKIVEGIINDIKMDHDNLPQEIVDVILERRLICKYCPENSNSAFPHCLLCGCDIKIKTACMSTCCGAAEFNKTVNESLWKEIKWQVYEKEGSHQGDN